MFSDAAAAAPIVSICHGPNEEGRDREGGFIKDIHTEGGGGGPKAGIAREVAWI